MKNDTVVIPAAGYGTRFLPISKSVPKELIPLFDEPALAYIIREALDAHCNHLVVVTNEEKDAIEHYFSPDAKLTTFLEKKNKLHLIDSLNNLIKDVQFDYAMQHEAHGLGHAILMAKPFVKDDYFSIILPDDIIDQTPSALAQLKKYADEYKCSVIAVQEVPMDKVSSYGIIDVKDTLQNGVYSVKGLVEKPDISNAPSRLAIVGRYIISRTIFDILADTPPTVGGEIQLTQALSTLLQTGEPLIAVTLTGNRYDIGNPIGWFQALVAIGLNHPVYAEQVKTIIKNMR